MTVRIVAKARILPHERLTIDYRPTPHSWCDLGPTFRRFADRPTALARRFYQMCMGLQVDAVGAAGITPLQYGAIVFLNRKDGDPGADQNALAARLGIDRSYAILGLASVGYMAYGSTPAQFAAALEELRARLAAVVNLTGAKPMR